MNTRIFIIATLLVGVASCSGGNNGNEPPVPDPAPEIKQIPICLDPGIATRATDLGFENDDQIGLYVVNYSGTAPGELKNSGNHADNVKFSYNSVWTPEKQIFWKNETTPADFYCYYPYATGISSVTAYPFDVKADQTQTTGYRASDFLWGKSSHISPTGTAVKIITQHVFSCAQIKLEAGDGFTTEDLAASTIAVKIKHTKTKAIINLATGVATATGDAQTTLPGKEGSYYKAIIVPQAITETDIVVVNVDGKDYTLNKSFTFEANKKHTFTIRINKTSSGINIGIGKWEEDDTDHGGTAE